MKTLYLIGGTMGVGKTATCQQLKSMLPNAVLLDGIVSYVDCTFADTGVPLSRVEQVMGSEYPKTMSDPVTFYYFKTENQEFYIADFIDNQTWNKYTTFDPEKEKKKKKSWLHISFHIG